MPEISRAWRARYKISGRILVITDDTKKLDDASHVIFPGVGAAGGNGLICVKRNSIPG